MKLISAKFKNFRLLRDVTLDFSVNPEKPLTVIRAENGSGKTTMLVAMQWCLYGDSTLPGRTPRDFRIHPLDWNVEEEGSTADIAVEVEFETSDQRNSSRYGPIVRSRRYRAIRRTTERIEGSGWSRSTSELFLFEITNEGTTPIANPNALLENELPSVLRGVFFTDGDRALDFIEADTSSKREKVRNAVRSLLDLDILDDFLRHVGVSGREVSRKAQQLGANRDLTHISSRIDQIDERMEVLDEEIKRDQLSIPRFREHIEDTQKKIEDALIRGDKEKLQRELRQTDSQLQTVRQRLSSRVKQHGYLFESLELGRDLLAPVLAESISKLDEARRQGGFPKTAIPVLRDRLDSYLCMCGESLALDDESGIQRRAYIQQLIKETEHSDELQATLSALYFGASNLRPDEIPEGRLWIDQYNGVAEDREFLMMQEEELGVVSRELDVQIKSLGNTDIAGLRDTKRQLENQLRRVQDRLMSNDVEKRSLGNERFGLERERNTLLAQEKRGQRILAESYVIEDMSTILKSTYERITKEELVKVSNLMNTFFLRMIGADPEQESQIRRTEINERFDILVYGPRKRMLDPDRDLSGAQRRALTIAFILGLTKVSEVEAPNVIDTPLGMMSGYVKTSVLLNAIQESFQLVLFLTRSEIAGCEDILDGSVGSITTLTNTSHYPRQLKNDPQVSGERVLQCQCNHRASCDLCERRMTVSQV